MQKVAKCEPSGKARHKGKQVANSGKTKPPFGGFGLNHGNWGFWGCIISPSLTSLKFQRTDDHLNL